MENTHSLITEEVKLLIIDEEKPTRNEVKKERKLRQLPIKILKNLFLLGCVSLLVFFIFCLGFMIKKIIFN